MHLVFSRFMNSYHTLVVICVSKNVFVDPLILGYENRVKGLFLARRNKKSVFILLLALDKNQHDP